MKKSTMFLALIAAVILFQGCSQNSPDDKDDYIPSTSTETIKTEQATIPHVAFFGGEYFGNRDIKTRDFNEVFHNNPIDKLYEESISDPTLTATSGHIAGLENRFCDYWKAEVDAVYKKLYSILEKEHANTLKKTQHAWKDYMKYSEEIRGNLLFSEIYDIGAGRIDSYLIGSMLKEETRARAIELMEFYYRLTGELEFVFKGTE